MGTGDCDVCSRDWWCSRSGSNDRMDGYRCAATRSGEPESRADGRRSDGVQGLLRRGRPAPGDGRTGRLGGRVGAGVAGFHRKGEEARQYDHESAQEGGDLQTVLTTIHSHASLAASSNRNRLSFRKQFVCRRERPSSRRVDYCPNHAHGQEMSRAPSRYRRTLEAPGTERRRRAGQKLTTTRIITDQMNRANRRPSQ